LEIILNHITFDGALFNPFLWRRLSACWSAFTGVSTADIERLALAGGVVALVALVGGFVDEGATE
jgi:hypothetical protein